MECDVSDIYCPQHERRQTNIEEINEAVAKHTGQWRILLVFLGTFSAILIAAGTYIHNSNLRSVEKTNAAIHSIEGSTRRIELTFSNYMAQHKAEAFNGFKDIDKNSSLLENHEKRILILER